MNFGGEFLFDFVPVVDQHVVDVLIHDLDVLEQEYVLILNVSIGPFLVWTQVLDVLQYVTNLT